MNTDQARRILGVAADADAATLRAAFNNAVKSAHPDSGGSEETFRLTVEAYRFLEGRLEGASPIDDIGDFQSGLQRLEITPSVAVVGGRVLTRLADGRRVAITVPPGLRQGDRIAPGGSILTIVIKGRPDMFVSGDDLCFTVGASETILREGGRVKIKTPTGPRMVWVPKQVGTNRIVRIPGQGLPAAGRHPKGAMILKLVPERIAREASSKSKLRRFASAWTAKMGRKASPARRA